jgi:hypothetical protein
LIESNYNFCKNCGSRIGKVKNFKPKISQPHFEQVIHKSRERHKSNLVVLASGLVLLILLSGIVISSIFSNKNPAKEDKVDTPTSALSSEPSITPSLLPLKTTNYSALLKTAESKLVKKFGDRVSCGNDTVSLSPALSCDLHWGNEEASSNDKLLGTVLIFCGSQPTLDKYKKLYGTDASIMEGDGLMVLLFESGNTLIQMQKMLTDTIQVS